MDLELRELRYALALARHRSYTRAAAALGLTQPALSRSIQGLEHSLGVRLFDRGRHGAEPTPLGKTLLQQAERVLDEAADFESLVLLQHDRVEGNLVVEAGTMASFLSVARACGHLVSQHPDLRIRLVTTSALDSAVQAVLDRRADLAVVELPDREVSPDLELELLPSHRGIFVCRPGHPLTEHDSLELQQILGYPLVAPRLTRRFSEMLGQRPTRAGRVDPVSGDFLPTLTIEAQEIAHRLIRFSDAVTLTPLVAVAAELEAGTLVALPCFPEWMNTAYGLVVRRGRTRSPGLQALITEILEIEKELEALQESLLSWVEPDG